MKTLKTIGAMALGLLLITTIFAACGHTQKEEEAVASKIEKGEALTESDYTVIVDYCVAYAQKAQEYQDKIDAPDATAADNSEYTEKLAALTETYKYSDIFFRALNEATPEQVGKANVEKVDANGMLDYFTTPDWANIQTSKTVEGFIEDMPSNDSSGVIANSDGEVVK